MIYRGYSNNRPLDEVIPQLEVLIRRLSHALFNQIFCQYVPNFYRWEGVPSPTQMSQLLMSQSGYGGRGARPNWVNVLKSVFYGIPKLISYLMCSWCELDYTFMVGSDARWVGTGFIGNKTDLGPRIVWQHNTWALSNSNYFKLDFYFLKITPLIL